MKFTESSENAKVGGAAASGRSWPDGLARYARDGAQPQRAPLIKKHARPAPLARAAGGKRDASGGSWPDGQASNAVHQIEIKMMKKIF